MARMSGGKALIESLHVHGLDTVFGVLGSTRLPAYDAFCDRSDVRATIIELPIEFVPYR
jgi:thiamine pyrophosphate-dependent acetolactate synthase large subunit-like protein